VQQLTQNARGLWKQLSKEEFVQLYRASFPKTFREMSKSDGHYKKVIPGVIFGMLIGILVANLLILHIAALLLKSYSKCIVYKITMSSIILC